MHIDRPQLFELVGYRPKPCRHSYDNPGIPTMAQCFRDRPLGRLHRSAITISWRSAEVGKELVEGVHLLQQLHQGAVFVGIEVIGCPHILRCYRSLRQIQNRNGERDVINNFIEQWCGSV